MLNTLCAPRRSCDAHCVPVTKYNEASRRFACVIANLRPCFQNRIEEVNYFERENLLVSMLVLGVTASAIGRMPFPRAESTATVPAIS